MQLGDLENGGCYEGSPILNLLAIEYGHPLNLIHGEKLDHDGGKNLVDDGKLISAVNFVGKLLQHLSWIVDTGATDHMIGSMTLIQLQNMCKGSKPVWLPNG